MAMTFFGTQSDIAQVWQWLFDVPEMRLFEGYSRPDKPNRWFDNWDTVSRYVDDGGWTLTAWPQSVGGRPRIERITFTPETQRELGGKGRTVLLSPASIRVNRNNDQMGCLADSSMTCWTEKGARGRSIFPEEFLDEVDWVKLRSIVSKIQRQITKASPAKLRACPIMPDAFEKLQAGEIRIWNWGEACSFPSPLITMT
jgi:hypothetical protein